MKRARTLTVLCVALALLGAAFVATFHAWGKRNPKRDPQLIVRFIETDEHGLRAIEKSLGFSLDPQVGRCVLTSWEVAEITRLLDGADFEVIGQAAFPVLAEGKRAAQSDRQLKYAVDFERKAAAGGDQGTVAYKATEHDTRQLGFSGDVVFGKLWESGRREIEVALGVTELSGWKTFGHNDLRQPVFKTWNVVTRLLLDFDETAAMVSRPYRAFEESGVFSEGRPARQVVFLTLVSLGYVD